MFKENLFTDTNPTQPERIRPEQKPALGDTPEMAKKREQLRKIVFNYLEKEGALSQGGVVMSTHIWRFLPQTIKVEAYVYKYAKNN